MSVSESVSDSFGLQPSSVAWSLGACFLAESVTNQLTWEGARDTCVSKKVLGGCKMCTQSWDMSITCCRKRRRRRKERRRRKAGRRPKAFDQSCPPIFWIRPLSLYWSPLDIWHSFGGMVNNGSFANADNNIYLPKTELQICPNMMCAIPEQWA